MFFYFFFFRASSRKSSVRPRKRREEGKRAAITFRRDKLIRKDDVATATRRPAKRLENCYNDAHPHLSSLPLLPSSSSIIFYIFSDRLPVSTGSWRAIALRAAAHLFSISNTLQYWTRRIAPLIAVRSTSRRRFFALLVVILEKSLSRGKAMRPHT